MIEQEFKNSSPTRIIRRERLIPKKLPLSLEYEMKLLYITDMLVEMEYC
jgi:hypothetical protein